MNVSITEAKAKLSELVRRANAGDEIVITRRGKAVARLLPPPAKEDLSPRIGALKGKISIADDFDNLGSEWAEYLR
ncbi:type II toxin-antitoxin system prevent-host-death family antitoxin [Mesorhizobium sp. WSM3859]|uniref:type II toxin-antitoxin system Phd/YefM family antitoxin n=1 Tax=Mesorhizobium sp. WSM3859 TaxID=2029402 RepID=UPI000BAF8C71|nr:type II toxin-antitoxin system prevent-host-death family antitoxin [Mesorhizobium sp. WSM3859]PBC09110.1 type II toxin-antitoxin system prevent-host-death family antitoxin [Mesorhizobium sp. WSM3859]